MDISMQERERVLNIIRLLENATRGMVQPAATQIVAQYGRNPFLVLISCLLSLRTKDTVSLPASLRLFSLAQTPEALVALPRLLIEKTIYPVGFYRRKTVIIQVVSHAIITRFQSTVPNNEDELLSLPGVGRKTANLVLGEGFGIPAICVDTHVHRISNRLGLVATTTPAETEMALKKVLPSDYWIAYNRLLVMWGQNICVPLSPFCSKCPLLYEHLCPQIGVERSR